MADVVRKVLLVIFFVSLGLDALYLVALLVLRRRGVYVQPFTRFGPAVVFDSQDGDGVPIRLLNVAGKFQSISYVQDGLRYRLVCVYHRYFAQIAEIAGLAGSAAKPRKKALVIGGGGYSFPKWLVSECPAVATTVVEIDPKIEHIARERFFLDDLIRDYDALESGRLRLVCADGWRFLQDCDERYDLIVNDAFGGRRPLGPLSTCDGAREVFSHLEEGGVYLANVISPLEGKGSQILAGAIEACKGCFEHVYVIPEAPDEPRTPGDNVLVASRGRLAIQKRYEV